MNDNNLDIHSSISVRFFEAVDLLKANGTIRGEATIAKRYGMNRMNMYTQRHNPSRGYICMEWLYYLVTDYSVSAEWLLTGMGQTFSNVGKMMHHDIR